MKVIYNGRIVEVDSLSIDGREIISSANYKRYEYREQLKTWQRLQYEMLISHNIKRIDEGCRN